MPTKSARACLFGESALEGQMKLTDANIRQLAVPAKGHRIYFDDAVGSFGVRVTAAGTRSFLLDYRTAAGRQRRYTIGTYPAWQVAAARKEAARLKATIRANGADPVGELQGERTAPTM